MIILLSKNFKGVQKPFSLLYSFVPGSSYRYEAAPKDVTVTLKFGIKTENSSEAIVGIADTNSEENYTSRNTACLLERRRMIYVGTSPHCAWILMCFSAHELLLHHSVLCEIVSTAGIKETPTSRTSQHSAQHRRTDRTETDFKRHNTQHLNMITI